ncbi:anaerobic ribonucleoside-triphosphate reductase [Hydrogenobacter thermophilus TK-6]|uniref:Anaerobic ribonucleoside-triphosphate reductase n=1 Tax=Hydrogenobacter thermophilus (strain DSM 6534 / IAM 12695 / TK-6) TaxID=608538 RepID=D3DFS6_HYDTT|nr:ribonucleoside triphosphate reductase [Hydrogenobacter thermophilus]ADO44618.1 anaerobic ribonucleoside-triphosphate reductase [Hydrogenobacter thermophilus TK-6]BAI68678.1 anaerobic ribonucleoside-triphosphate reductase [Hydrogenobacter thermophilus TK-6]
MLRIGGVEELKRKVERELPLVVKRDGILVPFDRSRIQRAMFKAFKAVGEFVEQSILDELVEDVVTKVLSLGKQRVHVEEIQDLVEETLILHGFAKTAKAYILYRKRREELRDISNAIVDAERVVQEYIHKQDWRVQENANASYSFSGLMLHTAGTVIAHYMLTHVYPEKIAKAHREGDFHIHDLSHGIVGYCAGWSLEDLLRKGFRGGYGKVTAGPAKHLSSLLGQIVNFLGCTQMEFAGAQALNSVDTYLAPFVRVDKLSYEEVKQLIQQLVFSLNVPSRWGSQAPFINFSFDWTVPEDMKERPVIIGGVERPDIGYYGDFQKEMDIINRAFLEVMMEGDYMERIFSFPIPTYNITPDFVWESPNARLLWRITAKYGIPYFQNFISSSLKPGDVRSMCCRLQLDLRELRSRMGGLFGSADKTGSIGVVTINLPRIAYLSKDEEEFLARLSHLMELARESLEIKRKVIERNLKKGLMPYTREYLDSFDTFFSTIGLIGMNEACLNLLGVSIAEKEGRDFAIKVLKFMREKLADFQEQTGHLYNLEATPAEGTSYRLAKIDKAKFPDIITAGEKEPYYTNSTHLPVGLTDDPFEVLEHQKDLQVLYTGGTVIHFFLQESPNELAVANFVKKVLELYPVPYITITPTFSVCEDHGYIRGEHFTCPECGKPAEVYSRVVGYYRPVQRWNRGKQEEFKDRLEYVI